MGVGDEASKGIHRGVSGTTVTGVLALSSHVALVIVQSMPL
jgi:hypothetical protein